MAESEAIAEGPRSSNCSGEMGTNDINPDASRTLTIGIHGARNTGKTCYLACLYGRQAADDAVITWDNDQSIGVLQRSWQELQNGDVPAATALTLPDEIRMNLHTEGIRRKLVTHDYAGALVQRSSTGEPRLEDEVKQWLLGADAILIFVGVDTWLNADDAEARERQAELDLFLNSLIELSADKNTVARPVALVLTKWDMVGPVEEEPAAAQERAGKFLKENSCSETMVRIMESLSDRFAVFPVSSFGGHRDSNLPPVDGPKPFNLHAPLTWAATAADEALVSEAHKRVQKLTAPGRLWKRYGHAVKEYDTLICKRGINTGPMHDEIMRELAPLKSRLHRRYLWESLVLIACVVSAMYGHAQWSYEKVRAEIDDATQDPRVVSEAVEDYTKWWNPMAMLPWFNKNLQTRRNEASGEREKRQFNELSGYRKRHRADHEAETRHAECQEFLNRWPRSEHADKVESWLKRDEEKMDAYNARTELEDERDQLEREIQNLGEDHRGVITACGEFLDKYPRSDHPESDGVFQEVEKWMNQHVTALENQPWYDAQIASKKKVEQERDYNEAIKILEQFIKEHQTNQNVHDAEELKVRYVKDRDDLKWQEILKYEIDEIDSHQRIIEKCQAYLSGADIKHRSDAEKLVKKHEYLWDKAEYDKLRELCSRATDGRSIENLDEAVEEYLSRTTPPRNSKAEEEAKKLRMWFGSLNTKSRTCAVTVERVVIPKWRDRWGRPEIFVILELEGDNEVPPKKTRPKNGVKKSNSYVMQFNSKLHGFPLQWNRHDQLRITVVEDDGGEWKSDRGNEYESVIIKDEQPAFVLGKANKTFKFKDKKGQQITVSLRCPKAKPPPLSNYPGREWE